MTLYTSYQKMTTKSNKSNEINESEWKTVEKKKYTVPQYSNQHIMKVRDNHMKNLNNIKSAPRVNTNKQYQPTFSNIIEKKLDEGKLEIKTISYSLQLQIQQARQQKNMSQKQLAIACNLTESQIKSYENGTALPNPQEINKMSKALEVNLKK